MSIEGCMQLFGDVGLREGNSMMLKVVPFLFIVDFEIFVLIPFLGSLC